MCEVSSFLWNFLCATLRCHFCTPVAISIHRDSRTTYIHSLLRSHCQLVSFLGIINHYQSHDSLLTAVPDWAWASWVSAADCWLREAGQHLKPQRKLPLGAMKHHVSNWLRHLQVCVLAMPRLGVWGTLWAASSYWFSFAAFASWHAEHGEIEEPVVGGALQPQL